MAEKSGRIHFAYGSNMDEEQMRRRCPRSRAAGVARLAGYRFLINSRGVDTVIPERGSSVWGVLWQLHAADEKTLDSCEGVPSGLYSREEIAVENEAGEAVHALVYPAADSIAGTARHGYMERIAEAAAARGFPQEYVAELRSWLGR